MIDKEYKIISTRFDFLLSLLENLFPIEHFVWQLRQVMHLTVAFDDNLMLSVENSRGEIIFRTDFISLKMHKSHKFN
jgi:hypothetical protein